MSDNPLGRLDPKKTADNMIRLQERIAELEAENKRLREFETQVNGNHWCPIFHSVSPLCDVCDAIEALDRSKEDQTDE